MNYKYVDTVEDIFFQIGIDKPFTFIERHLQKNFSINAYSTNYRNCKAEADDMVESIREIDRQIPKHYGGHYFILYLPNHVFGIVVEGKDSKFSQAILLVLAHYHNHLTWEEAMNMAKEEKVERLFEAVHFQLSKVQKTG